MFIKSCYLEDCLRPELLRSKVKTAARLLKKLDYDTLVCRGVSGLLLAPSLMAVTNKALAIVRKESEEGCHSNYIVEGNWELNRYIIVDDFIAGGNTVTAIRDALKQMKISWASQRYEDVSLPNYKLTCVAYLGWNAPKRYSSDKSQMLYSIFGYPVEYIPMQPG